MKSNKILFVWLAALLVVGWLARETIFVMDISNHGASGSKYASDPEYDVTNNNFSKSGQLTATGMKQMYDSGKSFKSEYIDQQRFMSSKFDPEAVYYHSVVDQSSLMSAYSFNLGAYPDSVSYLEFTDGLSGQANAKTHETNVRTSLGLSNSPSYGSKNIPVKTEEGFMYWRDPSTQCSGVDRKVQSNLESAKRTYDGKYRNLYSQLASKFGKSSNKFSFETTHLYLDDYEKAQQAGASYPKFPNQQSINSQIDNYERDYYYEGVLGGNHISRVISSPVLNYLFVTTFAKSEIAQKKLNSSKFQKLKYAHFFSDDIPFASLLKTLGYSETKAPSPAETMRFELFSTNGKQYVRWTVDGEVMNIKGAQNGILDLDTFFRTIYPLLYFGSIDNVCNGIEEISANLHPLWGDYRDYLRSIYDEITNISHKNTHKCVVGQKYVEVPHYEMVEMVRPVPVIHEQRIIERAVPVVEEKVVVKELEKIVQERPTTIHYLNFEVEEKPAALPLHFAEKVDDSSGFPWWLLLIPFICCIPLLAYYFCKKNSAEPEVKKKQSLAPIGSKKVSKPEVKVEEKPSPERRFVIEKKVFDEGEEIEKEIEKELEKSKSQKPTTRREVEIAPASSTEFVAEPSKTAMFAEASNVRGSGGGRKRRIKTIKKFGQVIGREEQVIDEFGNVISTKKLGVDGNELLDEINMGNYASSNPKEE